MLHLHPRSIVVTAALLLANVSPLYWLEGQALPPSFSSLQYTTDLYVAATPATPRLTLGDTARKYASTYWLEGALLAGIPLGILGAVFAEGMCGDPDSPSGDQGPCWDNALLGLGTGLGVGASLGGLIGGLIKKPGRKDQETIGDESP
jgi:F0F1-type ATP synthase membrane subunit c/vacuolar-type H+-ATPase subunit K